MGTDGQRKSTVYSVYHAKSLETEGELGSMVEKPSLKEKHGGLKAYLATMLKKVEPPAAILGGEWRVRTLLPLVSTTPMSIVSLDWNM